MTSVTHWMGRNALAVLFLVGWGRLSGAERLDGLQLTVEPKVADGPLLVGESEGVGRRVTLVFSLANRSPTTQRIARLDPRGLALSVFVVLPDGTTARALGEFHEGRASVELLPGRMIDAVFSLRDFGYHSIPLLGEGDCEISVTYFPWDDRQAGHLARKARFQIAALKPEDVAQVWDVPPCQGADMPEGTKAAILSVRGQATTRLYHRVMQDGEVHLLTYLATLSERGDFLAAGAYGRDSLITVAFCPDRTTLALLRIDSQIGSVRERIEFPGTQGPGTPSGGGVSPSGN